MELNLLSKPFRVSLRRVLLGFAVFGVTFAFMRWWSDDFGAWSALPAAVLAIVFVVRRESVLTVAITLAVAFLSGALGQYSGSRRTVPVSEFFVLVFGGGIGYSIAQWIQGLTPAGRQRLNRIAIVLGALVLIWVGGQLGRAFARNSALQWIVARDGRVEISRWKTSWMHKGFYFHQTWFGDKPVFWIDLHRTGATREDCERIEKLFPEAVVKSGE